MVNYKFQNIAVICKSLNLGKPKLDSFPQPVVLKFAGPNPRISVHSGE